MRGYHTRQRLCEQLCARMSLVPSPERKARGGGGVAGPRSVSEPGQWRSAVESYQGPGSVPASTNKVGTFGCIATKRDFSSYTQSICNSSMHARPMGRRQPADGVVSSLKSHRVCSPTSFQAAHRYRCVCKLFALAVLGGHGREMRPSPSQGYHVPKGA